jgi:hypothetical protein
MLCALFVWGCGGSSSDNLFKSSSASCTAGGACVGDQSCAGHQTCASDGTTQCTCDSTSSGGASNGAGGAESVGGSASSTGGGASAGGDTSVGGGASAGGDTSVGGAAAQGGAAATGGSGPAGDAGPQGTGTCPVGSYKGKLTGTYTSSNGLTSADVGSTITFSVASDGSITGKYAGPVNSKGTLTGMVDCSSGKTIIAVAGTYGAGLLSVQFNGTLDATYSSTQSLFIGGTWTLTEPGSSVDGGQGPWTQQ